MNVLDFPMSLAVVEYFYYNSADYLEDYVDDYTDWFPEEIKGDDHIDEQVDWLANFMDKHLKLVDTVTEYTDLEAGYEDLALIFEVDGKFYGFQFSDSTYDGLEANTVKLGECPEYKPVQRTTYERV
jgi:hypothetical protein